MTFQAYLDTIKEKTGKTPEDFRKLAAKKGLTARKDLMAWLKDDYGLGHGHANLIAQLVMDPDVFNTPKDEALAKHFEGGKAKWQKAYEGLAAKIGKFGDDIKFGPNQTYINVMRNGKKFAIIQPSADRFDIGIKLKGAAVTDRFEDGKAWNSMVTHRVRITDPKQIDAEVVQWLKKAYEAT